MATFSSGTIKIKTALLLRKQIMERFVNHYAPMVFVILP